MAALSSYPRVTTLGDGAKIPVITDPGGTNAYITADDLADDVAAAAVDPDVLAADPAFTSRYAAGHQLFGDPGPLVDVTIVAEGAVRPLEFFDGYLWGAKADGTIHRSADDGATWAQIANAGAGLILGFIPCTDGEMLVCRGATISRSTGWAANPATATWAVKLNVAAPSFLVRWGFDGDGTKFIATHYAGMPDWATSRYVWISVDGGLTWTVRRDQEVVSPGELSHGHAVCYDPWADMFWYSEGHDVSKGVFWSNDDGATWTAVAIDIDPDLQAMPTVMVATDTGIVLGSDSNRGGLYGIARRDNPADLVMRQTWEWWPGHVGTVGFAERGFRDPRTGLVYIGWKSDFADVDPIIAAGDANGGGLVWKAPSVGNILDGVWNLVVTDTGRLISYCTVNGVVSTLTAWTTPSQSPPNTGNILGGSSGATNSVAVGLQSTVADTAIFTVAIGVGAAATGSGESVVVGAGASSAVQGVVVGRSAAGAGGSHVAIGYLASASGAQSVVIGRAAAATGTAGIAIGYLATTTAGIAIGPSASASITDCIAIGRSSVSSGGGTTALGHTASASGANSTAVGKLTVASSTGNIAIGWTATANTSSQEIAIGSAAICSATSGVAIGNAASVGAGHTASIALGATSSAAAQLAIAARHVEIGEVTEPAAPAADKARLYVKDVAGKTTLCVRFATGAVAVLASEP